MTSPVRIVCAPNAYKSALSAAAASTAMLLGIRDVLSLDAAEIMRVPMADGGDGTLPVLLAAGHGYSEVHQVSGPTGAPIQATLGWINPTLAVVEMAEAAGIRQLTSGSLAPLHATSRGVGELIAIALDGGAERVIVGVGGSASSDGGAGLLSALGVRLLDAAGRPLADGGGSLINISSISAGRLHSRLASCRIDVACDVSNPLLGSVGAAAVFAPQKGASPAEVVILEDALARWTAVVERDLSPGTGILAERPMTGAAGGAAFGLAAIGANLVSGAALIADTVGLDLALDGAALCITGEGQIDRSTNAGKAPTEVARRCVAPGIPCVAIAGVVEPGLYPLFDETIAISDGLLPADAIARTAALLRRATADLIGRRFSTSA